MTPEDIDEMQAKIERLTHENFRANREITRLLRENGELRGFLERSQVFWNSAAVKEILGKGGE